MRRTISLVVLAFASYLPSGFFGDDTLLRETVQRATGWGFLRYTIDSIASGIYLWPLDAPMVVSYFRPLVLATVKLESVLPGHHAWLAHVFNLALHVVNVVLAARIGERVGLKPRAAALAALTWGVSIHAAPAVGWISGRSELLSALFVLAAVWTAQKGMATTERRWPLLCFACIVGACMSKESAVVAPLLVLLACAAAGHAPRSMVARRTWAIALFAPVVGYAIVLGAIGLPQLPEPYFEPIRSVTGVAWLAAKFVAYASGALVGVPLVPMATRASLESHPLALVPMLIAVVLAGVALRRRARAHARFFVAWFVVALAPYALVTTLSLYLYVPLLGVCWWIASVIQKGAERWAKVWMGWLLASGMVANVAGGIYLCRVNAASQRSIDTLVALSAERHTRDVLLLDAPYWSYSLPSAVRLRNPSASFRTHFINFSPDPGRGRGSSLHVGDRELSLIAHSPLFQSPFERFFLFGADPLASRQSTTRDVYRVSMSPDGGHELRIELVDSAAVVLQFDRWELREVYPTLRR